MCLSFFFTLLISLAGCVILCSANEYPVQSVVEHSVSEESKGTVGNDFEAGNPLLADAQSIPSINVDAQTHKVEEEHFKAESHRLENHAIEEAKDTSIVQISPPTDNEVGFNHEVVNNDSTFNEGLTGEPVKMPGATHPNNDSHSNARVVPVEVKPVSKQPKVNKVKPAIPATVNKNKLNYNNYNKRKNGMGQIRPELSYKRLHGRTGFESVTPTGEANKAVQTRYDAIAEHAVEQSHTDGAPKRIAEPAHRHWSSSSPYSSEDKEEEDRHARPPRGPGYGDEYPPFGEGSSEEEHHRHRHGGWRRGNWDSHSRERRRWYRDSSSGSWEPRRRGYYRGGRWAMASPWALHSEKSEESGFYGACSDEAHHYEDGVRAS